MAPDIAGDRNCIERVRLLCAQLANAGDIVVDIGDRQDAHARPGYRPNAKKARSTSTARHSQGIAFQSVHQTRVSFK
jgi:hypothetical protein